MDFQPVTQKEAMSLLASEGSMGYWGGYINGIAGKRWEYSVIAKVFRYGNPDPTVWYEGYMDGLGDYGHTEELSKARQSRFGSS